MEISEILSSRRTTFTEIAAKAGISRTTLLKVRTEPEAAKIGTLRAICEAMGYRLVLVLEKRDNEL